MRETLECYVLLFFVGSFLGWVMEVTCKLIQFRRFINRGFLLGPYCPIYGFGAVLVTALLSRFADAPVAVFVLAMAVCGALEYLTGYAMEKLFHARWWDYSQKRFNLNGRVCADTLIPFGLLGVGMVYVVKPLLFGLFLALAPGWRTGLCHALLLLIAMDAALSVTVLSKIRKTADLTGADDTEALTHAVRERLAQQSALVRRTLRAFPYARLYNTQIARELHKRRLRLRAELKQKRRDLRTELQRAEQKLRDDLKKGRD